MAGGINLNIPSHFIPNCLGGQNIQEIIRIRVEDEPVNPVETTRYNLILGVLLCHGASFRCHNPPVTGILLCIDRDTLEVFGMRNADFWADHPMDGHRV